MVGVLKLTFVFFLGLRFTHLRDDWFGDLKRNLFFFNMIIDRIYKIMFLNEHKFWKGFKDILFMMIDKGFSGKLFWHDAIDMDLKRNRKRLNLKRIIRWLSVCVCSCLFLWVYFGPTKTVKAMSIQVKYFYFNWKYYTEKYCIIALSIEPTPPQTISKSFNRTYTSPRNLETKLKIKPTPHPQIKNRKTSFVLHK